MNYYAIVAKETHPKQTTLNHELIITIFFFDLSMVLSYELTKL